MGMTIDEAMNHLIPPRIGSTEISSVQQKQLDAYTMARDTMRKYKKIEDIVEQWACCGNPSDSMIAISEVIEDGNNTTNTGNN